MNYEETLEYIHTINWRGSKLGLERVSELLRLMGNPEESLKFVHIAGTNGKGSTAAMLASILKSAGYKTGLYISPFIRRFNERMQINGESISDSELCEIVSYVRDFAEAMEELPTEFEIVLAVAMEYFKRNGCDVVVLEVGLGGRLDATNVIKTPVLQVITSIDFDHMKELGNTLSLIAAEKCGIIKNGVPTVSYVQQQEAKSVVEATCEEKDSALVFSDFDSIIPLESSLAGQRFSYKQYENLFITLLGEHQLRNASLVLEAVDVLNKNGFKLNETAVNNGLRETVWQARFQLLSTDPIFVVDGAHNPEGALAAVAAAKEYLKGRDLTVMVGVLGDKDYGVMLSEIDTIASRYVASEPNSPRALPSGELAEILGKTGKKVTAEKSVTDAVVKTIELAKENGGAALALGSLYMAGEIIDYFE